MKTEIKRLSECSMEDLKRILPKNRGCWDEDGNTDCEILGIDCIYQETDENGEGVLAPDCAFFYLCNPKLTKGDVDEVLKKFGDIKVRLQKEEKK